MSDQYASLGQATASHSINDLIQPLASGKGWMKFVGIMFIIQGAITALTIVGILIAWLPIWIGVLLVQSAGALERAQLSGDAYAVKESLSKLSDLLRDPGRTVPGKHCPHGAVFHVLRRDVRHDDETRRLPALSSVSQRGCPRRDGHAKRLTARRASSGRARSIRTAPGNCLRRNPRCPCAE